MIARRELPAARLRLGMRFAWGGEVVELVRPARDAVKRGYGRVWVGFDTGDRWAYYPHDWVTLAAGEDAPADPTMDDWPGRWWPADERTVDDAPVQRRLFDFPEAS